MPCPCFHHGHLLVLGEEAPTAAGHKPKGVLGDIAQSCLLREDYIRLEAVNGDMKSPVPHPPLPLLLIHGAGC